MRDETAYEREKMIAWMNPSWKDRRKRERERVLPTILNGLMAQKAMNQRALVGRRDEHLHFSIGKL